MEINYDRLRPLTRVIQLDTIILIEGSLISNSDPRELVKHSAGGTEYAVRVVDARWWRIDGKLDVVLGYRVAASLSSEAATVELFSVNARFLAAYNLPDEHPELGADGHEIMSDLVTANGQINVFPYLRQLVSDQTSRAGWPPLVMKLLKAPAKRPKALVRMAPPWPRDVHS